MAVSPVIQQNGHSPTFSYPVSAESLSFDPQMFTKPDFNMDTLMENIRDQVDLKEVDKQLRQILQHFQYALINLINNDYTQFVELSSSLVALDKSVETLDKEHEASWEDYTAFAKKLAELYSFFEKQQSIINESRAREAWNVCELNVYLILDEVIKAAKKKQPSWLKYSFSRLNLLNVYLQELASKDASKFQDVKNTIKPSLDFIKRVFIPYVLFNPEDLASNYYMLLNIRELDMIEEGINIASRGLINYSKSDGSMVQRWKNFLDALNKQKQIIVDSIQASSLSSTAKSTLTKFYLSSLLTFMAAYTKDNFEYDFIPSDPEPFQESFLAFHQFYQNFPEYHDFATYFKKILSYFDISVYIELWIKDSYRSFIDSSTVENVKVLRENGSIKLNVSESFISTIQALCSVKMLPGCSSFVVQTFYNVIENFYDFCENMRNTFGKWNTDAQSSEEEGETQQWEMMLILLISMKTAVNESLNLLENKLYSDNTKGETNVPKSNFSVYRHSVLRQFEALELQIETLLQTKLLKVFVKHVSNVGNVPKKYRWTKMPFPTEQSDYVNSIKGIWESFIDMYGQEKSEESQVLLAKSLASALDTFITKATEVLDTVDKTANVLRQKGKSLLSDANDSDESKMKQQIILDTEAFISLIGPIKEANEIVQRMEDLLTRAKSSA